MNYNPIFDYISVLEWCSKILRTHSINSFNPVHFLEVSINKLNDKILKQDQCQTASQITYPEDCNVIRYFVLDESCEAALSRLA